MHAWHAASNVIGPEPDPLAPVAGEVAAGIVASLVTAPSSPVRDEEYPRPPLDTNQ
jgi:hypothetical protein